MATGNNTQDIVHILYGLDGSVSEKGVYCILPNGKCDGENDEESPSIVGLFFPQHTIIFLQTI